MIKSIIITSHFHSRIGKGCNRPIGCWCSSLTSWYLMHLVMYFALSFSHAQNIVSLLKKSYFGILGVLSMVSYEFHPC
jgi:hypothetical protein